MIFAHADLRQFLGDQLLVKEAAFDGGFVLNERGNPTGGHGLGCAAVLNRSGSLAMLTAMRRASSKSSKAGCSITSSASASRRLPLAASCSIYPPSIRSVLFYTEIERHWVKTNVAGRLTLRPKPPCRLCVMRACCAAEVLFTLSAILLVGYT
jgi:hypothetical protein